ncbi:hypothetical protein ES332_D03G190500v1 [Gossypium tomentosum]|uniref:Aminotransferase class V domain-containing protein n=1 Tax=Gossypium tomentosum TaxID=34277 RepID=A0A5D2LS78_GOSTO|nr:hypothetical protein ES332_D03G190500v1 [Gossypium tomentosum]
MQSPWIREASKACCSSSGCCPNPFLGFPHYVEASSSSSKPQSAAVSRYQFETDEADKIRASEYPHLDSSVACFDYIGHGLFSYSQLQGSPFFDICCKSINLNSQLLYGEETEFQSGIKKRIMSFMNVSETDYTMVFTANQASAFKLLVESYPFGSNQNLLTVYDYQSEAIDVMIERAKKRGANCMSACFSWSNLKIQTEKLRKKIIKKRGLFVIPLQSKVTGSRYSYTWLSLAQENGWHVLLDATALGAKEMETLGLSLFDPDFLICSFFKVFGENPSGFCCLFIKKSIGSSVLKGSTTNVGIVSLVPPLKLESPKGKAPLHEIEEIIDSRTSNTLQCKALDHADSLGLVLISSRTRSLINWLVNALMSLQHPHSETGIPAVKIYGPKVMFDRGPAVAFNVFDWKGERIHPALVQKLADRNNISLSIGCLQHIWFSDKHEEMKEKDKFQPGIDVVTAAVGYLTNFEDIYRLWVFVSRFLDADFLDKEKWRYKALNQRTIEI